MLHSVRHVTAFFATRLGNLQCCANRNFALMRSSETCTASQLQNLHHVSTESVATQKSAQSTIHSF